MKKIWMWLAGSIAVISCGVLVVAYWMEPGKMANALFGKRLYFNPTQQLQLAFVQTKLQWLGWYLLSLSIAAIFLQKTIFTKFSAAISETNVRKHPYLFLFVVSFVSLYFELIFIRWVSAEIRIFSFFKNIPLLAAFFGLGLGCLLTHKKPLAVLFLPLLAIFIAVIGFGSDTFLRLLSQAGNTLTKDAHVWGHTFSQKWQWLSMVIFYGGVLLFFLWQVVCFIPLGQLVGQAFEGLEPLRAYSINIFGSLTGILAYYVFAHLHTSPITWFIIGMVPFLWILHQKRFVLISGLVLMTISLFIMSDTMFERMWSPYNRLSVVDSYLWKNDKGEGSILPSEKGAWVKIGYRIDVNDLFFMDITDFSTDFLQNHPKLYKDPQTYGYNIPYHILKPKKVLIVGAGAGNDVAAALRHGVDEVHAVEIDPIIAAVGKKYHPEKPYSSPKVKLIINDARHHFTHTTEKYDLVVFGLLDSHSLFSTHSSVRLDNYVYTLESFAAVKNILKPQGTVFVTFATEKSWMLQRFALIFEQVFAQQPQIVNARRGMAFVGGLRNDYTQLIADSFLKNYPLKMGEDIRMSTDDWPFMYMKNNSIPMNYIIALTMMILSTILLIYRFLPRPLTKGVAHFFWLGVAFLLIEAKSITELALLWGSTWIVSSVVITTIMILILLANLCAMRFRFKSKHPLYVLLLLSIAISYSLDLKWFIGHNFLLNYLLPTLLICLPLFFAGIIFAVSFRSFSNPQSALGWNLLGAFLGGIFEYSSLIFGFKMMAIFAAVAYILSWIYSRD